MNYRDLGRDDFKLKLLLGMGKTAQVYLAEAPDGLQVALKLPRKEVREDERLSQMFAQEVRLALGLRHPNLLRGYAGKPFGDRAFVALEYMPGGTLENLIRNGHRFSTEEALSYIGQLASALIYLHGRGIIHQDVKPSNVFLADKVVKLGDFGVARTKDNHKPFERAGSPFYMAPELFRGQAASPASDAYSLGVLAYELLLGRRPFYGDSFDALMAAHLTQAPPPLNVDGVPAKLQQRIRGLLAKDPAARTTLDRLLRALSGKFTVEIVPKAVKARPQPWYRKLFWRKK
ncbi:serine/threonine-protein kinase [Oceanithermus sp.]